jgi:hypothetical protein
MHVITHACYHACMLSCMHICMPASRVSYMKAILWVSMHARSRHACKNACGQQACKLACMQVSINTYCICIVANARMLLKQVWTQARWYGSKQACITRNINKIKKMWLRSIRSRILRNSSI